MKIRLTPQLLFSLRPLNFLRFTIQKSCYNYNCNITLFAAALIYKYKFQDTFS